MKLAYKAYYSGDTPDKVEIGVLVTSGIWENQRTWRKTLGQEQHLHQNSE